MPSTLSHRVQAVVAEVPEYEVEAVHEQPPHRIVEVCSQPVPVTEHDPWPGGIAVAAQGDGRAVGHADFRNLQWLGYSIIRTVGVIDHNSSLAWSGTGVATVFSVSLAAKVSVPFFPVWSDPTVAVPSDVAAAPRSNVARSPKRSTRNSWPGGSARDSKET